MGIEVADNAHCIETAGWPAVAEVLLQEILRRADKFALLGTGDGFQRAAQVGFAAIAYFHKHQHVTVPHDQIDFACLAQKVTLDQFKSPLFQEALRQQLRLVALELPFRWLCDFHCHPCSWYQLP